MKRIIEKKEQKILNLESQIRLAKKAKGEACILDILKEVRDCLKEGEMSVEEAMDNCIAREYLTSTEENSRYAVLKAGLQELVEGKDTETGNLILDQLIVDFR